MQEFYYIIAGIILLVVLAGGGLMTLLCIRKIQPGRAGHQDRLGRPQGLLRLDGARAAGPDLSHHGHLREETGDHAQGQGRPRLQGQHPRRHHGGLLHPRGCHRGERAQGRPDADARTRVRHGTSCASCSRRSFPKRSRPRANRWSSTNCSPSASSSATRSRTPSARTSTASCLQDVAIDYLEQTPLDQHDPNNVLDSEGIKKITEITQRERVVANEFTQRAQVQVEKENADADIAKREQKRRNEEDTAKQTRAITEVKANEEAESRKVIEARRQEVEGKRLEAEESIRLRTEDMNRAVQEREYHRHQGKAAPRTGSRAGRRGSPRAPRAHRVARRDGQGSQGRRGRRRGGTQTRRRRRRAEGRRRSSRRRRPTSRRA